MPLTESVYSYPPVLRDVLSHWEALETAIERAVFLKGDYKRADQAADLLALDTAIQAQEGLDNQRQLSAGQRDAQKKALALRADQFAKAVRAFAAGTPHEKALPKKPAYTAIESKFERPMRDSADLWKRIEADATLSSSVHPLVLAGGYTHAQFESDLVALTASFRALEAADRASREGRRRRDAPLRGLRERVNQYRAAAQALLPEGHPLLTTLPVLSAPVSRRQQA
ncbi:hypothetical protein [Armatimonas sp.]|uniref:hypothetical protein n=1 Tax=Armatimonas sp. TaxID=1872638 RepID=UPI0037503150